MAIDSDSCDINQVVKAVDATIPYSKMAHRNKDTSLYDFDFSTDTPVFRTQP